MFLCDLMASLADKFNDPKIKREAEKIPGRLDVERVVEFSRELISDQEIGLYAYDRSALLASGDLRVDRQNDIEKIAEMILEKPRKVFIEANYADRDNAFSRIKSLPDTGNPMIGKPVRVGNLFDIQGDGRAKLHVVWTTPKSEIRTVVPEMMRTCNVHKSAQKHIFNAHSLNVSSHYLDIDTTKKTKMTLEEFKEAVKDPSTEQYSILQYSMGANSHRSLKPERALKEAYDLFRLNSMATMEFDRRNLYRLVEMSTITGMPPAEIMDTLQKDLDGELVLGLAMLALLEIDDLDIQVRREGRRGRIRDRKGVRKPSSISKTDYVQPRLSVVNMKIGEDLVSALYAQRSKDQSSSSPAHAGSRQSPGFHPVQGHMFRARNGKIVYRKPHFRGVKSKRALTKVSV